MSAAFVRVSARDRRYFELSDGRPYLPIGLNFVSAPPAEQHQAWLDTMAAHRLNFCRVWAGQPPFDPEHERSGEFDPASGATMRRFCDLAGERGIKVKLCLDFFRDCPPAKTIWSDKVLHNRANGGPFADFDELIDSAAGRAQWVRKYTWWREQLGDHPAVWGWELWNEMNAVQGGRWQDWTRAMLPELQRLFPEHLCVQSLGSFDVEAFGEQYRELVALADNDVAQVHRYLDLGASWDVCHGPVDVLAAEAVRSLLAMQPGKPVILAESGAVEPCHSGPFKLYAADTDGTLLHDVVWAPFMAGAAGPGHTWHWDHYVRTNNLWWQYQRFAEAVDGLDPAAEGFEPVMWPHDRLRVYALVGRHTVLVWCRDGANDWTSELRDQQAPELLSGLSLDLPTSAARWRAFDPWTGAWSSIEPAGQQVTLPDFQRSVVLRGEVG